MQHLFQSSFLQALGYAIANSLWQMALVWLIYMSITGLMSISSAAKYRLAVAAQVTGFIWFIVTFQFYYQQYNQALHQTGIVPGNIQTIVSTNTDLSSQLINWMVKAEQLLPYVSMAYICLMVFLCIRWFMGYRQTQQIRNNGLQKMPAEWRLFVNRIAGQLNIKKKIQVFLSDTVTTPLTIGFFKPVILIPVASINHLTTDQLEAVLLHELAHIKRYDYLVNIILSVVEISLFFNPFTQLLSKNIRKERENSCDDWVLQFQYDASLYAEALLRIAYLQSAPVFAMAAAGKKNELLVRVKRMIDKKENRFSYRKQLLSFVIVTGILSSIAWLNPMTPHTDKQNITNTGSLPKKNKQAYAVEPMAVSVANPLFNPIFFLSEPLKEKMKENLESAQKEMNEAAFDYAKLAEHPIESITPLVAGAMKQAAIEMEMAPQNIDWEKSMANIDAAKMNMKTMDMNKLFRLDSLLPLKLRRQFKEEMNSSMKKMEVDIKNAKTEIERSLKAGSEIVFEKEKVQADIQNAMQALEMLNKMGGLDNLVLNSLKIAGLNIENSKPRQKMKQPALPQEENSKPRMRMPSPDKEPVKTETIHEEVEEIQMKDDAMPVATPVVDPQLVSLLELAKTKLDMATIIKIKNYLVLQGEMGKRIKVIPAINKDKKTVDERRVEIQLQ
ncbi:MAG: M56 family metallopeptidase [Bacteroidota bacterium]